MVLKGKCTKSEMNGLLFSKIGIFVSELRSSGRRFEVTQREKGAIRQHGAEKPCLLDVQQKKSGRETKGKNGEESERGQRKEGRGERQRDREERRKEEGERLMKTSKRKGKQPPPRGLELWLELITPVWWSTENMGKSSRLNAHRTSWPPL